MNTTRVPLWFADQELANALVNAKPPEGVKVTVPETSAGATPKPDAGFHVVIEFSHAGSIEADLAKTKSALGATAGWVANELQTAAAKRDLKTASINGDDVVLNKTNLNRIIRKEVATQIKRDSHLAGRNQK